MTRTLNDTNGGWGSSFQTLDMGDMGVLSFDSTGGALVGITANDDLLPTAYEEAWTGVSGSGVAGVGSTNVIGYRNTFGIFSVSAGYSQLGTSAAESASSGAGSHGSATDIYVSVSPIDGLTVGGGHDHHRQLNHRLEILKHKCQLQNRENLHQMKQTQRLKFQVDCNQLIQKIYQMYFCNRLR